MAHVSPELLSLWLRLCRSKFISFVDEALDVHPSEPSLKNGKVELKATFFYA